MINKKKVLITGAAGFIGSYLVDYLVKRDFVVYGTSYLPTVDLKELNPKAFLQKVDIRNKKKVLGLIAEVKPDIIFHLAGQSYPTVSLKKPAMTIKTNVIGTINLFESVKRLKMNPLVIVAGSSAEYGLIKKEEIPVHENYFLRPLHAYGISKVCQELLAYQYFKNYKIKAITLRIFNTTGPRKVNDVCADFTRQAVLIKKGLKKYLRVGNLQTSRAITDVRDAVRALYLAAEKCTPGESYNLCGNKSYLISDILKLVLKISAIKAKIKQNPRLLRPTDELIIYGDCRKFIEETGWQQKIPLEQTISDMLKYWEKKL